MNKGSQLPDAGVLEDHGFAEQEHRRELRVEVATDAHVVLPEPDDALVGAFGELIDDYPRRTRRLRLSLLEAFYLLHQERRLQLHTGPGGTAAPMDETESWAAFSTTAATP